GLNEGLAGATGPFALAHDDIDELVGHHDDLCHLAIVYVAADAARAEREPLELLARGSCRRADAVANLAIDLQDELERVGVQHRGIGHRPWLLPHAPPGNKLEDLGAEMGSKGEH